MDEGAGQGPANPPALSQVPLSQSRFRRLLPGVVAAVLFVDIVGAVGVAIYQTSAEEAHPSPPASHARAVPNEADSFAGATGTGPSASIRADGRPRKAAVRQLLARRARAIRAGDRAGFLATVANGDPRFRARQRQLFRNLSRLPLAAWKYEIASRAAPAPPRGKRPSANVWTPRLLVRYRFDHFDKKLVTTSRYLTFTRGPQGWRVSGLADETERSIWDLGAVHVVRADHTLVLGLGTPREKLRAIATRMDRAVPVIADVWGSGWSRRVVVLVPATQEQARVLSPDAGGLDQITAVATVASGPHGVPPPGSGDRVIVNPANFSDLSPLGRRVVLRHELTHVATRAYTDSAVPMWLIEGFADYVGYHGVELPARSIARELGAALHTGHAPRELPVPGDFAGGARHLTRAYEAAWLACELIAQRHGEQRLVRLYRAMGSDPHGSDAQVRREAMRSVLGTTPDKFAAAWRSYVRVTLR